VTANVVGIAAGLIALMAVPFAWREIRTRDAAKTDRPTAAQ